MKTIYQDTLLVSGIMCYQACGNTIQHALSDLDELIQQGLLPRDARLILDAEPQAIGIHRVSITIQSSLPFNPNPKKLAQYFKTSITDVGYDVIDETDDDTKKTSQHGNGFNLFLNVMAMVVMIVLSIALPPSLPLTIGLIALSFLTTAWTARHYFIEFLKQLRTRQWLTMPAAITFGWLLSLAHALYHAITMPLMMEFAMTFMNVVMPVMLVTIVNLMESLQGYLSQTVQKMQLRGMKALFPTMANAYDCYEVPDAFRDDPQAYFTENNVVNHAKRELTEGMYIRIKRGDCFPVDGIIVHGRTLVEASIMNGESQQLRTIGDKIPAGSLNLGRDVVIRATATPYNSTINRLLFRSHRNDSTEKKQLEIHQTELKAHRRFTYAYSALILLGVSLSIILPLAMGVFSVPILLQSLIGTLFAICPCTIGIAHQLPRLLSLSRLQDQGILLRSEAVTEQNEPIHTIVFDKTGTLTTGKGEVESYLGLSPELWQRIYLLEKKHGAGHPIANAICDHYESAGAHQHIVLKAIDELDYDAKNRGLSARVQGKRLHIGSLDYIRTVTTIPPQYDPIIQQKMAKGYTPVGVAESGQWKGILFIKHEVKPELLTSLRRLKSARIKRIMLTGDKRESALGLNKQLGLIFDEDQIHAEQSFEAKETFLSNLMESERKPRGVWFIGDGLNDAPAARIVREKGGVSCSMTAEDKSAFFADLSLNGSLDYLFSYQKLNRQPKKNVLQNQGILAYGAVLFLVFLISFPLVGVPIVPLIPMTVMVLTTILVLFNSFRMRATVDYAVGRNKSWIQKVIASDGSIGLLAAGSGLLALSLLVMTLSTGHLALPLFVFTAGAAAAVSSGFLISSVIAFGVFAGLLALYAMRDRHPSLAAQQRMKATRIPLPVDESSNQSSKSLNFGMLQARRNSCVNTTPKTTPQQPQYSPPEQLHAVCLH